MVLKVLITLLVALITNGCLSQDEIKKYVFRHDKKSTLLQKGDSVAIINADGQTVFTYSTFEGEFEDVFAYDEVEDIDYLHVYPKKPFRIKADDGTIDVYNMLGELNYDSEYDSLFIYTYYSKPLDTLFIVYAVPKNNKWRLVDRNNKTFGPDVEYDDLAGFIDWYRYPFLLVTEHNDSIKYLSFNDQILYDGITGEDGTYYEIFQSRVTQKSGLVRYNGECPIPLEYDMLWGYFYEDSLLECERNGLKGLLHISGKELIPVQYKKLVKFFDHELNMHRKPYLAMKEDRYEVLVYSVENDAYVSVSEPIFIHGDSHYDPSLRQYKFEVVEKRKPRNIVQEGGQLVWKKKLNSPPILK